MNSILSKTHHCIGAGSPLEKITAEMAAGTHIRKALVEAGKLALEGGVPVEFEFNGDTYFIRPGLLIDALAEMKVPL